MSDYIEVGPHVLNLVWKKGLDLSASIGDHMRDLMNSLPDDQVLCDSACMQMFTQAIVTSLTLHTIDNDECYLDDFCQQLRETHSKIHHGVKAQMKELLKKIEKDD